VTQLARALGRKNTPCQARPIMRNEQAKALGFNEVVDTSLEKWVTACVVSRAVTAQTLSSTESVVKSLSEALGALAWKEAHNTGVFRKP